MVRGRGRPRRRQHPGPPQLRQGPSVQRSQWPLPLRPHFGSISPRSPTSCTRAWSRVPHSTSRVDWCASGGALSRNWGCRLGGIGFLPSFGFGCILSGSVISAVYWYKTLRHKVKTPVPVDLDPPAHPLVQHNRVPGGRSREEQATPKQKKKHKNTKTTKTQQTPSPYPMERERVSPMVLSGGRRAVVVGFERLQMPMHQCQRAPRGR